MQNAIASEDIAEALNEPLPWDRFSGRTVLVTGAAGFLPAYMVETLLHLNVSLSSPVRVVALVRNEQTASIRFRHWLGSPHFSLVVQDICDRVPLPDGIDYIIHAASQASPRYYQTDPVGTLSANVIGTYNLLSAIQNRPIRGFLLFSSGEIYGSTGHKQPIGEDDFGSLIPTTLRASYAESKRMAENMCVAWHHQFGVPTRIVRPFHTYGPGMKPNDGRVFADFVRDILNGGPIVLQSDGRARRCFCYLGDANRAFFRVLLLGQDAQAYNVANPGAECSIGELADRLAGLYSGLAVSRHEPGNSSPAEFGAASAIPDIAKISALGWSPHISIEQGFIRTIQSYKLDNLTNRPS